MKKMFILIMCFVTTALFADGTQQQVGIVNFSKCMTDSDQGKKEFANFEKLKKQLSSTIEELEKQVTELSTKLQDKDHMDTLSPEAEKELTGKFQVSNEQLGAYQQQFYSILQNAQMQLYQLISVVINQASETVATREKIDVVLNKEACFYVSGALDITDKIIEEMNLIEEKAAANADKTEEETQAK